MNMLKAPGRVQLVSKDELQILPADNKAGMMIVCDIWQGPAHNVRKERHTVALPDALKIAQEALGRGYLVNMYPAPDNGNQAAAAGGAAA